MFGKSVLVVDLSGEYKTAFNFDGRTDAAILNSELFLI